MENSLLNHSKKELAEQHEKLVGKLMELWMVNHRMEDWISPLDAVAKLTKEQKELE